MEQQTLQEISAVGDLLDPGKIVMLLSAIFVLWAINKVVRHFSEALMKSIPARRFMILQLATLFTFVWYFIGTYWLITGIIQPPREMTLALGGSAAVAIGIALKDVVASIIAGIILLFDRPFQVGDRVDFNGTYGEIISIGLRSVRLNTLDDNIVTIPNSRFITEMVSTGNAGALDMMVVCDFHIALDADIALAQNLIHEVVVTSRFAYLKKPVSIIFSEVVIAERLALQVKVKAYVIDVYYEKAFQSDIVKRVSRLFIDNAIARPQRESASAAWKQ
ncbi:MAG: mechanosensitive ion channel protein [Gammaproteobacteria bacterium]|nr:MAG: mechanosensitive ion channel protein [Pseudomonadota bacterium]PIE38737.1 MAG: mechanosensitive ion channel protein [Gammaproteobacteria bacterium]